MPMIDQGEADDKIIAVCADDPEYKHFNDIKELPPHRLAEIRRFFEDCILVDPLIFRTMPSELLTIVCFSFSFFLKKSLNLSLQGIFTRIANPLLFCAFVVSW